MTKNDHQHRAPDRIDWSGKQVPIGQPVSIDQAIDMARASNGCQDVSIGDDPGEYDSAADEVDIWQAADNGSVSAMLKLVYLYGVRAQADQSATSAALLRNEMAKWLQRAVVAGSTRAVGLLGMHLHEHPTCDVSLYRGIELLRLAAAAGDVVAMRNLGCVLVSAAADRTNCSDTDSDGVEGAAWLARAAASGDFIANNIISEPN